jgi:HTH-type transcriptional regulator / antitoxin HigA
MTIRPIRTPEDHDAAIARLAELWSAAPGTDEGAELDALATLIDTYETRILQIPAAKPHDVLRYAVNEMGRSQADLARLLGSRSRASEVLSGRRALTLEMIRAIGNAWKIPVQLLIGNDEAPRKRRSVKRADAEVSVRPVSTKSPRKRA